MLVDGVDHALLFGEGDGLIFAAVKRPHRHVFQFPGPVVVAFAGDGRDGGEGVRAMDRPVPHAVRAEAQTGEVHAIRIDVICGQHVIEQGVERFDRPPFLERGQLRRHQNEREIAALRRDLRQALIRNLAQVVSAFPRAVQDDDQRKFFAVSCAVVARKLHEKFVADRFADRLVKRPAALRRTGGGLAGAGTGHRTCQGRQKNRARHNRSLAEEFCARALKSRGFSVVFATSGSDAGSRRERMGPLGRGGNGSRTCANNHALAGRPGTDLRPRKEIVTWPRLQPQTPR